MSKIGIVASYSFFYEVQSAILDQGGIYHKIKTWGLGWQTSFIENQNGKTS